MAEGRVLGIGGVFIRSPDPLRLARWYREHMGMVMSAPDEPDPSGWVWDTEAGSCVFSAFRAESDYFAADRQAMLNLRVEGLEALVAKLEAAGLEVTRREVMDGVGTFARVHDCDGNPLELWEPA